MAKKKTPPRRSGKSSIQVWVDARIRAALAAYVEASDPRTDKTAVVESALRKFLESKGFWPPADAAKPK